MTQSRRLRAPGFGIAGAVLLWVGASSFGDTPDTRETTAAVAHYFTTNRTNVLVGAVLFGAGLLCLLAVSSRVAAQLESAGQPGIGRFAHGAGDDLRRDAPRHRRADRRGAQLRDRRRSTGYRQGTVRAHPGGHADRRPRVLAAFMGAIAIGLVRSGSGRRWFPALTGAAAVAFAVTVCSFAASGPFSPDVQQQVLLTVLVVWLGASGRGRRSPRGRVTGPRPRASRFDCVHTTLRPTSHELTFHTCAEPVLFTWAQRDSNPRPMPCKGSALTN